jgi:heptose III glucuronosyltransferase
MTASLPQSIGIGRAWQRCNPSTLSSYRANSRVTQPTLSVVIPVHNAAGFLAECIDSVLAEAPPVIEIVAVDDGSTDASEAMLKQYAEVHSFIRIFRRSNAGPAAARNFGLTQATGKYVWFVDADDVVKPGAWRAFEVALAADPDIAVHNGERFGGDEAPRRFFSKPKPAGCVSGKVWVEALCEQREFHHLVYLHVYRREFLVANGLRFLEGILHEDIGWVTESYLCAHKVIYSDRVLYGYRRNAASLTGSREDGKLMKRIESYFAVIPQLRDINRRRGGDGKLAQLLSTEVVAQGLQIDRLASRLASRNLQREVRSRCRAEQFWTGLWRDAATFKAKRQLAKVILRGLF